MTVNAKTAVMDRLEQHEMLCREALTANGGSRGFAMWKAAALQEVQDVADRAERMELLEVDLRGDLNLIYRIKMPVPLWRSGGQFEIGDSVLFHLVYTDDWRLESPPGWAPVGVLEPFSLFHPNSRPNWRSAMCLGDLPAAIAPKELILLGYYLASLQDYTLDERDPHGVMNAAACEYYRCHPEYLPLTKAGLFDPWSPEGDA